MTEQQFAEISQKLSLLARLAALSLVAGKKQQEQVLLLGNAGLRPREIAEVLGTTSNTVSVALSMMRKKRKRGV